MCRCSLYCIAENPVLYEDSDFEIVGSKISFSKDRMLFSFNENIFTIHISLYGNKLL